MNSVRTPRMDTRHRSKRNSIFIINKPLLIRIKLDKGVQISKGDSKKRGDFVSRDESNAPLNPRRISLRSKPGRQNDS